MASVWQRLTEIVGSASERTGVVGSLANLLDPDNWLPGGKDAAFTLALIALSAKMAVSDGVVTASELRAFHRTVEASLFYPSGAAAAEGAAFRFRHWHEIGDHVFQRRH